MRIIKYISEIKNIVKKEKMSGKSIGLVPTMGYLHEGHLSLIRNSSCDNGITSKCIRQSYTIWTK